MQTDRPIAVLGALDTKGAEFAYLIERITGRGRPVLTIDTGVLGEPCFTPDVSAERVAVSGGASLQELRARADRRAALAVMARGAANVVAELHAGQRIAGIIGMGGSGGTAVFASAVESLPVGFPKLLVTTLAPCDTGGLAGAKDLVLVPSVVDVAGLNRISRRVIANSAAAICGMVEVASDTSLFSDYDGKTTIAATMLGVTTPAVDGARRILENEGYQVLVFHAIGSGGRTMESLIGDRMIDGVLDLTTTELTAQLLGAPSSAGERRLYTAGELGLPQVIAPGGMDLSIFGRRGTLPAGYARRQLCEWTPDFTLLRTTPDENAKLGHMLVDHANRARGPVAVLLPLLGLSALDAKGKEFWDPEADAALFAAVRQNLRSDIRLVEVDAHINDRQFARCAAMTLLELIREAQH